MELFYVTLGTFGCYSFGCHAARNSVDSPTYILRYSLYR